MLVKTGAVAGAGRLPLAVEVGCEAFETPAYV